ncbi:MAG: hypothetical protein BWY09_03111 [Candidatus Hydrogenedentes bacterium ADurb.Bin179]|nr:MAG: hypothetical protein BWY09_03111 [Candidatus Hydrogenedentes bacterium ADurb.Bin179]
MVVFSRRHSGAQKEKRDAQFAIVKGKAVPQKLMVPKVFAVVGCYDEQGVRRLFPDGLDQPAYVIVGIPYRGVIKKFYRFLARIRQRGKRGTRYLARHEFTVRPVIVTKVLHNRPFFV